MLCDISYPFAWLFYYKNLMNESGNFYETISAIFAGIAMSAGSIAIWLFSIKMWALAQHLTLI